MFPLLNISYRRFERALPDFNHVAQHVEVKGAVVGFSSCVGTNLKSFHRGTPAPMTHCVTEEGFRLANMATSMAASLIGVLERDWARSDH